MKTTHSEAFVEPAVIKLLSRGKRTMREVVLELIVNHYTTRNWTEKRAANKAVVTEPKEKRFQGWSSSGQLQPTPCQARPCRRGAASAACSPTT
ncbi:MAG: hypothetical protein ABI642_09690 [Polaromonas sp.]